MDNSGSRKYFSIGAESHTVRRVKSSRFLAFSHRARTTEEAGEYIREYKKKYYDASHVCYAYIVGLEEPVFKAHDAGEPRHSAGDPILNQIRSAGLINTLVIVVRYFGGTQLGMGGLMDAYKEAAASVLQASGQKQVEEVHQIILRFPYPVSGPLLRLLDTLKVTIIRHEGTENGLLELLTGEGNYPLLIERVGEIPGILIEKDTKIFI